MVFKCFCIYFFYFISLCGGILHLFRTLALFYRILLFFLEDNNNFRMWMFNIQKLIEHIGK